MTWNKCVRVDFLCSNCILEYVSFPVQLVNSVIRETIGAIIGKVVEAIINVRDQ